MSVYVSMPATIRDGRRTTESRSSFFFWMSVVFVAIALAGFARSYLMPVATGTFGGSALLHVHGALFFGWTLLLVSQTRLVARRRIALHRAFGVAGVAIAAGMLFTAVALVAAAVRAPGVADSESVGLVAALPLSQIALFAAFFAAGVANARRSETHKRCMLVATANLLSAPSSRLIATLVSPESAAGAIAAASDLGARLAAGIGGMVAIDLIVVAAMLYDRRAFGRVHRVYVVGLAAMLLTQILRMPLAQTTLWRSFIQALATLGG